MRQFFYPSILLGVLFLVFWMRTDAQMTDCDTTLSDVRTLVAQAKTALDNGDTTTANALLSGAQALIDSANMPTELIVTQEAVAVEPEAIATQETAPASTPLPEATAVAMLDTDESANRSVPAVNAPEIQDGASVFFLRFANTSIDSGPIDIYSRKSGDQLLVENLAFGQTTEFATFAAGNQVFIARPAGSGAGGEELYRLKWDFNANSSWMVIAAGLKSTYSFIVEPITIIRNDLDNGKARVRVVNWVSGGERLSVTTDTGVSLASGLGWVGVADNEIDPGEYSLNIATASGVTQGDAIPVQFEPNTIYVLLIVGGKDGTPSITLMNSVSSRETTRVRFINNRSDAVDLHFRPSNERLITDFSSGTTTEYIVMPSGAVTFVAYAPGTGPKGQEKAAVPVQLRPGYDVTITLSADGGMDITETVLNP